ncbi:sugar phosphate isomerase/epimerase [Paeniglutamicibacter psychrophenolicus]|uniref:Inosose dehydratase n=1 Tax=Paeniglutamicibacter psychrophenolicus TaxID=257454 RepID=A0ABS4WJD0_9MICC|nr:sugar phosphate isomerase/epimerase [Paeniglutamicibacter psychrophenolicus]MBP2376291.1 inosose dehydratase [Paeniglutamicibacter psychrophenolicus]
MSTTIANQLAAAPISWGVCEAADWGVQLSPEQVLGDMRELGIKATEFGPLGFLPTEPSARAAHLEGYGMKAVGGFLPVVLHDQAVDPLPLVEAELKAFSVAGASVLVLAADAGTGDYEAHHEMDESQWEVFGRNLQAVVDLAAEAGILAVLHPHVGTMVESAASVQRLLETTAAQICLDTGHLLVGGTNPLDLVRLHASRVGIAHLKDVRSEIAAKVASGELGFVQAVKNGMFVPLGQGDCEIGQIVGLLKEAGYKGWYVMEQDAVLESAFDGAAAKTDVRASIDFLLGL